MPLPLLRKKVSRLDQANELADNDNNWRERPLKGKLRSFTKIRSVFWKIFFGMLSEDDTGEWIREIRQWRKKYQSLIEKHVSFDPKQVDEEDLLKNNPLSSSEDNIWTEYFKDEELKKLISKDLERLFPEYAFFSRKDLLDDMLRVLFIWSKENEAYSYKQGFHDLLGVIMLVNHRDCHHIKLSDEKQETFDKKKNQKYLDIIAELCDPKYIQHDSYWMLCSLLLKVRNYFGKKEMESDNHFIRKGGKKKKRISSRSATDVFLVCERIQRTYLKVIDPDLYRHFEQLDIQPQVFLLKWVRLLFLRTFHIDDVMVLWDCLFAHSATGFREVLLNHEKGIEPSDEIVDLDNITKKDMHNLNYLIEHVCLNMVLYIRNRLLREDVMKALQTLMNHYPPVEDVVVFYEEAQKTMLEPSKPLYFSEEAEKDKKTKKPQETPKKKKSSYNPGTLNAESTLRASEILSPVAQVSKATEKEQAEREARFSALSLEKDNPLKLGIEESTETEELSLGLSTSSRPIGGMSGGGGFSSGGRPKRNIFVKRKSQERGGGGLLDVFQRKLKQFRDGLFVGPSETGPSVYSGAGPFDDKFAFQPDHGKSFPAPKNPKNLKVVKVQSGIGKGKVIISQPKLKSRTFVSKREIAVAGKGVIPGDAPKKNSGVVFSHASKSKKRSESKIKGKGASGLSSAVTKKIMMMKHRELQLGMLMNNTLKILQEQMEKQKQRLATALRKGGGENVKDKDMDNEMLLLSVAKLKHVKDVLIGAIEYDQETVDLLKIQNGEFLREIGREKEEKEKEYKKSEEEREKKERRKKLAEEKKRLEKEFDPAGIERDEEAGRLFSETLSPAQRAEERKKKEEEERKKKEKEEEEEKRKEKVEKLEVEEEPSWVVVGIGPDLDDDDDVNVTVTIEEEGNYLKDDDEMEEDPLEYVDDVKKGGGKKGKKKENLDPVDAIFSDL